MRLWSLHPELLDRAALVAGWREALLAQKVLQGATRGYRNHPQLERFKASPDPVSAIATFLHGLAVEADSRGYQFNRDLIAQPAVSALQIPVTAGQLSLELTLLRLKVAKRDPAWLPRVDGTRPHPLFTVVPGPVESWERAELPTETS